MTITIKEIAKEAGVNVSTVSRVLNGKGSISKETKEKIMKIAQENGYKPNLIAKSLQAGLSHTICLLVPHIQNLIFPQIAKGVEDVARENGYTVVLCNSDDDTNIEKNYIDTMLSRKIDGFILSGAKNSEDNIQYIIDNNVPCVLVNRFKEKYLNKIECVGINNYQAAYDVVRFLYEKGYRKIAFTKGNLELIFNYDRYNGYLQALKDLGLTIKADWIIESDTDDFYNQTIELFNLEDKPDCVFAASDPKAFYVLRALLDMNMNIPNQVGLVGFDNVDMSELINPSLTTVSQPLYEFGRVACQSVIKQIKYKIENNKLPKAERHILPYDIVVRETTR